MKKREGARDGKTRGLPALNGESISRNSHSLVWERDAFVDTKDLLLESPQITRQRSWLSGLSLA